jgi:hypothetical protein
METREVPNPKLEIPKKLQNQIPRGVFSVALWKRRKSVHGSQEACLSYRCRPAGDETQLFKGSCQVCVRYCAVRLLFCGAFQFIVGRVREVVVSFFKVETLSRRRGRGGRRERFGLGIAGEPETDGAGLGIVGISFENFQVMLACFGRVMQLLGVEITERKM